MTQRAPRAALSAVAALALVALVLATAGLLRPGSANADPSRAADRADHASGKERTHVQKRVKQHTRQQRVRKSVSLGLRAVQTANHLTGVPYRWGGASPAGFDCSGLVQYVYAKIGIRLPHHAASQYGHGRRVARSALRAGDLVFFSGLGHVGIYAGGGKFIHAPRSGTTVRWSRLSSHGRFYGARRLVA